MPLSENEQRMLEQMERAIYAEDPRFASTMTGPTLEPGALRQLVLGGSGVLLGLIVLVVGVAQESVALGIVGFIIMLGATSFMFLMPRKTSTTLGVVDEHGRVQPPADKPAQGKRAKPGKDSDFMNRMEERWEKRRRGEED